MNKNKLLLLLMLMLAGCGGGEESTPTPPTPSEPEEVIDNSSSNVMTSLDSFAVIKPYEEVLVNLTEHIPFGAKITQVVNKTDDPLCAVSGISDMGFTVKIDDLMACRYSYSYSVQASAASASSTSNTTKTVRAADTDYKETITVLASTSESSLLRPIGIAMISEATLTISLRDYLGSAYPTGYILQAGPTLAGNGQIVSIDATGQNITFKAGAEGMSRITYTLKGTNATGEADINLGVIDIAASNSANRPPEAKSDLFTSEVANDTETPIDVTGFISSSDGGDLQLVYVSSMTAYVEVKKADLNNITNKVFYFKASTPGTHMVTYAISDHRGGYAIGVIQVNVSGLDYSQWNSLFHKGNMFIAPLTALEASAMGVKATSLTDFKESSYAPSIPMATFNYTDAKNYCELVHKGRLPTIEEVSKFFQQTDIHNPLKKGHWPISANYYIAYSSDEDPNDKIARLYNLTSGETPVYDEVTDQTSFYVTCVVPTNITFKITKEGDGAVANNIENILMIVTVTSATGESTVGKPMSVEILTPEGVTPTEPLDKTTELVGSVLFAFKSTTAGTIPLKITFNGNIFLTNITFVADPSTAKIIKLTKVRDNQPAGRPYEHNAISLTAIDAFNNPVPGMKLVLSGGNEDANFFAANSEMATDVKGRLIDYGVRLFRLPKGKLTKTDTLNIQLDKTDIIGATSEIETVELTNTYPAVRRIYRHNNELTNILVTAAATVEEAIAAELLSSQYTVSRDDTTGFTYALMDQETGRIFCDKLVKHGYSNWALGHAGDISDIITENVGSPLDRLEVYNWPNGNYWSGKSGTGVFTPSGGGANSGTVTVRMYIPCSRTP